jgi:hypothetical protein
MFDASAFETQVMSRLPGSKQRIAWIADCLEASLQGDHLRAVNLRSLPAPCNSARSDGDFGDLI